MMTHEQFEDQISQRIKSQIERWDYIFGREENIDLVSGKGKNYLINYAGLKEAYDAAIEKCPIAADAILVLMWNHILDLETLKFLYKDTKDASIEDSNRDDLSGL